MDILIIFILIITLCFLGLIGFFLIREHKIIKDNDILIKTNLQEIIQKLSQIEEKIIIKEEQDCMNNFKPYLSIIIEENCPLYNSQFEKINRNLKKNTFYTIVFEKDGFGKLFSSEDLWVSLDSISKNFEKPEKNIPAKIKNFTCVYNGPGRGYHIIAKVSKDTNVEIIDGFGVWKKVRFSNGQTGFIEEKVL